MNIRPEEKLAMEIIKLAIRDILKPKSIPRSKIKKFAKNPPINCNNLI